MAAGKLMVYFHTALQAKNERRKRKGRICDRNCMWPTKTNIYTNNPLQKMFANLYSGVNPLKTPPNVFERKREIPFLISLMKLVQMRRKHRDKIIDECLRSNYRCHRLGK